MRNSLPRSRAQPSTYQPLVYQTPKLFVSVSKVVDSDCWILGMISLGGGLPSSQYFPFESLDVKVPALGKFSEAETTVSGETITIGKHDVPLGKSSYGRFTWFTGLDSAFD